MPGAVAVIALTAVFRPDYSGIAGLFLAFGVVIIGSYAVAHHTAVHRLAWLVLLVSTAVNLVLSTDEARAKLPMPLWPAASLIIYAAFLVAIIVLLNVRQVRPSEHNFMDTGIVAAGLLIIGWTFVLRRLGDPAAQTDHMGIDGGFLLLDLVMVALLVRIAFTTSSRNLARALLAAAGVALLVGHITTVIRGGPDALTAFSPGDPAQIAGQLSAVCVAAASLCEGRRRSDAAAVHSTAATFPIWRLAVFVAVALIAPFVPVVGLLSSEDLVTAKAAPALIGSAALTCLVMVLLVMRLANFAHLAVRRADALNSQSAVMLTQAAALQEALDEQHALQDVLAHRALHDPLTGLANRSLLSERLTRVTRRETGSVAGLLLIDLDGFKEVNDTLGHPVGDDLLTRVAHRLIRAGGHDDVVARLGGDEFAVLITDGSAHDSRMTAQRVIEIISGTYDLGDRRLTITASAGLLILGSGRIDAAAALRDVDLALYAAKRAGRNQVVEFRPAMRESRVRHAEIAADVRSALERNELSVHYQPIVDLATGHTVALEALMRWHMRDDKRVTPTEFIAVAEDVGLIGDVGSEVLRTAVRQASLWHAPYQLTVAVNISGRQLATPNFAGEVLDALDASPLAPTALILEITESVLVDATNPAGTPVMSSLQILREQGIRIAVDDFGTGYSSLAYLRRLPIDILKIDQLFTSILDSPSEHGIRFVGAIVELGASLGMTVIAEGVETPRQVDLLQKMGCPLGQGFYFAHPCSSSEVTSLFGKSLLGDTQHAVTQDISHPKS
ncbi:putative bifunctional diguanylate cyclase/phosphodiesterase [Mycolicibacterium hodleri]|uniref:putative bifunctional diguanylate cyclase/phosphodiesterase n=1 Tax=Mycolicibacterium hodleri TaxID=49897 RepID=UPI00137636DE|nr:GGDEF domain-containing phosphodiesterase [Mycolicibacterium hodleri]